MAIKYNLHLKGYVGDWDFDPDYVDYILSKYEDEEVNVLIDSLGGSLKSALTISSAFKNHGNVHVHFVGMNASAATIASMGAKHISIDASAMYLVHKCSMVFFQWEALNADQLQQVIEEYKQNRTDMEKFDLNIAQIYAGKCKKATKDLLELMKVGGWLTAQEALDWGFVDEITDNADDVPPQMTNAIASAMANAGMPIPDIPVVDEKESAFSKFIASIAALFKSKSHNFMADLSSQNPAQQAPEQSPTAAEQPDEPQNAANADDFATRLSNLEAENANLKAQIDALTKNPNDNSIQVVESAASNNADFNNRLKRASDLFKAIP
jgi:ATP-dependent protease ClpP protease subunit